MPKIQEIAREYFENDPSIQTLIKYLYSLRFKTAWKIFITAPEVEDIFEWMGNHGVNIESEILIFAEEVQKIPFKVLRQRFISGFSLNTFEDELKDQIDFDGLDWKIEELLKDENDLAQLYLILSVTKSGLENIFNEPEIEQALQGLSRLGINLEKLKNFVYKVLKWN